MEAKTCTCTQDCEKEFNPNCECEAKECHCRDMANVIGEKKKKVFETIVDYLNSQYDMEKTWNRVSKNWDYEYKFRKGGRTLCAFYLKKDVLGFMVILGKNERDKFEQNKNSYTKQICDLYDQTKTYHDGKWLMIELEDNSFMEDVKQLLLIKRKPNKKKQ